MCGTLKQAPTKEHMLALRRGPLMTFVGVCACSGAPILRGRALGVADQPAGALCAHSHARAGHAGARQLALLLPHQSRGVLTCSKAALVEDGSQRLSSAVVFRDALPLKEASRSGRPPLTCPAVQNFEAYEGGGEGTPSSEGRGRRTRADPNFIGYTYKAWEAVSPPPGPCPLERLFWLHCCMMSPETRGLLCA